MMLRNGTSAGMDFDPPIRHFEDHLPFSRLKLYGVK
jgi:hypothetical protein